MFNEIKTVLETRGYKQKFLLSFFIVLAAALLLMNFVSAPALFNGELLVTPEIPLVNVLFVLAFSLLAALAITLHAFKFEQARKAVRAESVASAAGLFLGLFTSACSICYPLVLTLLGVPTALAVLPFGGFEIQTASLALLFASVYFSSRQISKTCLPPAKKTGKD